MSKEGFKVNYFREGKYEVIEASGPCGFLSKTKELGECLVLSGFLEGMCRSDRKGELVEVLESTGPSGVPVLLERRGSILRVRPFNRSLVNGARILTLKRDRAGAALLSGRIFALEREMLLEADKIMREILREVCSE